MTSHSIEGEARFILKVSMAKNTQAKAVKAVKAAAAVKKGNFIGHQKKIRTSVHFHRPKTLELKRNPKYKRYAYFPYVFLPFFFVIFFFYRLFYFCLFYIALLFLRLTRWTNMLLSAIL